MPPVAAEILSENQWSDFITRSLHLLYYDLANIIISYLAIHHGVVCTL